MKRGIAVLASACVLPVALGVGSAWAEGKVTITRESTADVQIVVRDVGGIPERVFAWQVPGAR